MFVEYEGVCWVFVECVRTGVVGTWLHGESVV